MENRQIDNKTTKQIRIDSEVHRLLKIGASKVQRSIKELSDEYLLDGLERNKLLNE